MVEYTTNQYRVLSESLELVSESPDTTPNKYYFYFGKDGQLYYTECPPNDEDNNENIPEEQKSHQSYFCEFPDATSSKFNAFEEARVDKILDAVADVPNDYVYSVSKYEGDERHFMKFYYDTINVYLIRGYNFNAINGISLRVHAKAWRDIINANGGNKYKEEQDVVLLDYFLSKDKL